MCRKEETEKPQVWILRNIILCESECLLLWGCEQTERGQGPHDYRAEGGIWVYDLHRVMFFLMVGTLTLAACVTVLKIETSPSWHLWTGDTAALSVGSLPCSERGTDMYTRHQLSTYSMIHFIFSNFSGNKQAKFTFKGLKQDLNKWRGI